MAAIALTTLALLTLTTFALTTLALLAVTALTLLALAGLLRRWLRLSLSGLTLLLLRPVAALSTLAGSPAGFAGCGG